MALPVRCVGHLIEEDTVVRWRGAPLLLIGIVIGSLLLSPALATLTTSLKKPIDGASPAYAITGADGGIPARYSRAEP